MTSTDPDLGKKVSACLEALYLETPMNKEMIPANNSDYLRKDQFSNIWDAQRSIMEALRLDVNDDSLLDTPRRVAKMYCEEVFSGLSYENFPKCTTVPNAMNHNELVIVNADVLSMCEHHFVPFIGEAHVAYIPSTKVMGLSKFPRVVDFFARRPQIQERLTAQIHAALCFILDTDDVAVTMKAEHMCMRLRGVRQNGKSTTTSKMSGKFMDKPELREEFLMLTRNNHG